mgnify:FL=1
MRREKRLNQGIIKNIAIVVQPHQEISNGPDKKYGGVERVVTFLIEGLLNRNVDVSLYTAKKCSIDCRLIYPMGLFDGEFLEKLNQTQLATYSRKIREDLENKNFDVIIAPEHDDLKGENVISSKGSIHYITQPEIEKAKNYLVNKFQNENIVSLILGGPTKYYSFSNEELIQVFRKIKSNFISQGHKVLVIPSMRTPKRIIDLAMKEFVKEGFVVNTVDKQAYLSALALAANIVVTCDSTSMISEAAASGKPIFVAHMEPKKNNYRFKKFFQLFKEMGITKELEEKIDNWTYNRLNEADRIAILIRKKLTN